MFVLAILLAAFFSSALQLPFIPKSAYGATGTQISGIIWDNTTWTEAGSPYTLVNDTTVAKNVTLTITPGSIVNLTTWSLIIAGTLCARGNQTNPIVFYGALPPRAWPPRIFFNDSMPWNESSGIGCIIEFAQFNVTNFQYETVLGDYMGDYVKISNNVFYNYGNDAAAIRIKGFAVNNTVLGGYVGILAEDNTLLNNTVKDASYGIRCSYMSFDPPYRSNITGNLLVNNTAGIYVSNDNVYAINNTITNNTRGVYFDSYAFYRSVSMVFINNSIHGNNYDVYVNYADSQITIDMTNNWWGTTNATLINEQIYDHNDNGALATVTYQPFLASPPPSEVVIPEFQSSLIIFLFVAVTVFVAKHTLSQKDTTQ